MATVSRKLVKKVGFSSGCAEFAPKYWRAVPEQGEGEQGRERHQDAQRGLEKEVVEIAQPVGRERLAAVVGPGFHGLEHDRRRRHPRPGGDELQEHQGDLPEVRQPRFARVVLQVAVDQKRNRGDEREVKRHRGVAVGVERQPALVDQHEERQREPQPVDGQHGAEVLAPAHLATLVDTGGSVDEVFDGSKNRVEPGLFPRKDAGDVPAERVGQRERGEAGEQDAENLGLHGAKGWLPAGRQDLCFFRKWSGDAGSSGLSRGRLQNFSGFSST